VNPPALRTVLGLAFLATATACPDSNNANPPVLWLDLDGSEIKVRLVEREPIPY
jgi:hypothetical protein